MDSRPHTILLVDDSAVNRELGKAHLERGGFVVVAASDGEEALVRSQENSIDLVLLDIMMPGMSGLEVLASLRRRHPPEELPVIMATAKDQSSDMVEAFDLGANDYVTKPLDWAVVQARILAHLRASRARRDPAESRGRMPGPGQILAERYRLESLIGRGRHGIVYRAQHLELDRPVAVKLIQAPPLEDQELALRLEREGISACRVQHPNAVSVFDFALSEEGFPFLVMELLEGEPLDHELARGPLTPERCAQLVSPICSVLTEAHGQGVIHRDIKPQNIFLARDRSGEEIVKVVDFGIATFVDGGDTRLTAAGNRPGTPAYMAPERFSDEPYDGRVDVYSLGVMLYELLSGRLPFQVDDGNLLRMVRLHLTAVPEPLETLRPEAGPEIARLVGQAMAKNPADRPTLEELDERFVTAVTTEQGR